MQCKNLWRNGPSCAVIGWSLGRRDNLWHQPCGDRGSNQTRACAAVLKALSLTAMALWVLGSTAYHVLILGIPRAEVMGVLINPRSPPLSAGPLWVRSGHWGASASCVCFNPESGHGSAQLEGRVAGVAGCECESCRRVTRRERVSVLPFERQKTVAVGKLSLIHI